MYINMYVYISVPAVVEVGHPRVVEGGLGGEATSASSSLLDPGPRWDPARVGEGSPVARE